MVPLSQIKTATYRPLILSCWIAKRKSSAQWQLAFCAAQCRKAMHYGCALVNLLQVVRPLVKRASIKKLKPKKLDFRENMTH